MSSPQVLWKQPRIPRTRERTHCFCWEDLMCSLLLGVLHLLPPPEHSIRIPRTRNNAPGSPSGEILGEALELLLDLHKGCFFVFRCGRRWRAEDLMMPASPVSKYRNLLNHLLTAGWPASFGGKEVAVRGWNFLRLGRPTLLTEELRKSSKIELQKV